MAPKRPQFRPLHEMSTSGSCSDEYMHVVVRAPVLAGYALRFFCWLLESKITGALLKPKLKKDNLITKVFMESRYEEPPMYIPQFPQGANKQEEPATFQVNADVLPPARVALAETCLQTSPSPPSALKMDHSFRYWSIRDYAHAYTAGTVTPTQVAKRFLAAVEESVHCSPAMDIFIDYNREDILRQAGESTSRYEKGEPLSILDGIPIAVKDEIDCLPYATTGGTKWLHKVRKVTQDAVCIKRLRDCGAVLVGKSNMHELGMGTTGINPHYGAPRNPHDVRKCSGGSSGGSAVAVASGLCPAALGVDGGGSVRMPAGLCGIVGFKPTFGRTSNHGVLPLNWTLGMVGALTATVEDALLVYAAIHGHEPGDRIVSLPPIANLPLLRDSEAGDMRTLVGDIRLAKYTEWFDDSDDGVRQVCYKILDLLQQVYSCKVIEVTIPELEEMRLAHFVTIGSECSSSVGIDYEHSGKKASGADVRVGFSIYESFNNRELIAAQRMRFRQMHYHTEIFEKAHVIVTPTTGATAPLLSANALQCGELNYVVGAKLMRYQIAGNFLGLPAISVPVGYDTSGMPVGLQLIGRPWSEATLLRLAWAIEGVVSGNRKKPEVFYNLVS